MTTLTGGPVFWILAALAVCAAAVFFERFLELRRAQIDWQDFIKGVKNILDSGNVDEALAICDDASVPVANIMATAIRHRSGSDTALREAVDAQGRAEIGRLDRRLASLAIIGQLAPLLGLLGTVIGLIKAVLLVNGSEIVSRAALMSASMEALVCAAVGLGIAIPVAVMHGSLRIRMDRIVTDLEAAATLIVNDVVDARDAAERRGAK